MWIFIGSQPSCCGTQRHPRIPARQRSRPSCGGGIDQYVHTLNGVEATELPPGSREPLANGRFPQAQDAGNLCRGKTAHDREEQRNAEWVRQPCKRAPNGIAFGDECCRVTTSFRGTISPWLNRDCGLSDHIRTRLLWCLLGEGHKLHETTSSVMHLDGVHSDAHQPGLRLKVGSAGCLRSLNRSQRLEKRVLGQILTDLPVAHQAKDDMKHEFVILVYELLNCLGSR